MGTLEGGHPNGVDPVLGYQSQNLFARFFEIEAEPAGRRVTKTDGFEVH